MKTKVKYQAGPCLICGGRPLRNGRRRHDPERHQRVAAARGEAWVGTRRWPALAVEAVGDWWQKR